MKLTTRGCELLKSHYERAKGIYSGKPYQRANLFERAYLTDLLQDMVDAGTEIHCEEIDRDCIEIDTIEDFERAVERIDKIINAKSQLA